MTEEEIRNKLVGIIKPYVRDASLLEKIQDETDLIEDLQINSSRVVDIVLALEDDFDIEIPDDEATEGIQTIGEIVKLVKSKVD